MSVNKLASVFSLSFALSLSLQVLASTSGAKAFSQDGQQWVENADWRFRLIRASTGPLVKIGSNLTAAELSPIAEGDTLAVIELEVEAKRGEAGRLRERLMPYSTPAFFPEAVVQYLCGSWPEAVKSVVARMHDPANVEKISTRPLVGFEMRLVLAAKQLAPNWVEIAGYGVTERGERFDYLLGNFNPAKDSVVFYRRKDLLAGWIQPSRVVPLTVLYVVPKETSAANFRFYDLPEQAIRFSK